MTHGLSKEDLALLSPEELAAVEAEPSEEEAKLIASTAANGGDASLAASTAAADDEATVTDKADAATEAKPAAGDKPDAAAAAAGDAAAPAGDASDGEREPFAVPFHHQASIKPEDAQARMVDLQKQYVDGGLTLDELLAKRDEINRAVITDEVAAKISDASKEQTAMALWTRAVDDFLDTHTAYKDPVLKDALDSRVKVLAGDKSNDKLSDRQLLQKAHDEIAARFKVDTKEAPRDPKKAAAESRRPDRSDVPVTLGGVPAVADNAAADDEFSEIDRLTQRGDSLGVERALAKMTSEQQDRYLRAGVAA